MAKKIIRTGTTADPTGDSLKNAFVKVNENFTELYNALGLVGDITLNLGNFKFTGSTLSLDDPEDSTLGITIDTLVKINSDLTVGGDIVPQTANGGDLGSSTLPWRSLYVSNNTIYIGGTAVGLDANGNLTTGGTVVGSTPAWANITGKPTFATVATTGAYADLTGKPTIPTLVSQLSNDSGFLTSVSNIQSESDVSIQVNLTDSTARIWRFGEDGDLTFPDGTVQTTAGGGAGSTLVNGAYTVSLGSTGTLTFPTLTVPIEDNANPVGTGQVLKFSDSTQQAIIFGPVSTVDYPAAQRIIIQGAPGYTGTAGEGGDVYVWAGPGGSVDGNGGDIKVRAGQGNGSGNGGYLNFQAGDSGATSYGGYINIESGSSNTAGQGGDITIRARSGGNIDLYTTDSAIRLNTNGGTWSFAADDTLTLPQGGVIAEGGGISGAIKLTPSGGANVYQALLIYPTAGEGDHIHLTAGGGTTELYLGNDLHFVKLESDGNIRIQADNGVNGAAWTFGTDGGLTFPNGTTQSTAPAITISADDSTQRTIFLSEESIKFVGAGGVTTASDAEGNITITGTAPSTLVNSTKTLSLGSDGSLTSNGALTLKTPNGIPTSVSNWQGQGGWNQNTYTNLATTGGTGTGLTVDVAANGAGYILIGAITINTPGTGYTAGDVITIDNENSLPGTFTIGVAGTRSWQLGIDGKLTLPAGGAIADAASYIKLTPAGGANEYQALLIYPTAGDGNHIHLTAGGGTTELYLGNDLHYVKLASGGVVRIQADDGVNSSAAWTFGTDGAITTTDVFTVNVPNGAVASITGIVPNTDSRFWDSNYGSNLATTGGTGTGLTVNVYADAGPLGNDYANVSINQPGTGYTNGDVINVENYNDEGGALYASYVSFTVAVAGNNSWQLRPSGLKFPDNTVQTTAAESFSFSVAADDSTQRAISNNELIKFVGAGGVTTASDAEGNITITGGGSVALPVCVINSSSNSVGGIVGGVSVNFTVTNPSGAAISEIGIFLPSVTTAAAVTVADSATAGTQAKTVTAPAGNTRYWAQIYAVTPNGTAYSAPNYLTATHICLLAGTMIALADGTYKAIEDITYTDRMLSWDFDRGCYAETTALWIKQAETGSQYNLLTFSDGTTLRTFDQHRIFNKQAGAFTYPMTAATPIGTITVNEHGEEITLISKEIVVDTIEYYNVITDHHMNLFSDTVLTSCRFNNIYPILDMKFVKDSRMLRTRDEFENIPDRFFYGLRLAEQTFDLDMIEWYVTRLLSVEQSFELALV